jgi:hypothetical protein
MKDEHLERAALSCPEMRINARNFQPDTNSRRTSLLLKKSQIAA